MEPLKIGQKIVVLPRRYDAYQYPCVFSDEMLQFIGKTLTIRKYRTMMWDSYELPCDGYCYGVEENDYAWTTPMFRVAETDNVLKSINSIYL